MNKTQADAITHAILEPDRAVQEELRRKRAAEAKSLADRRLVEWFVLVGLAIGAAIAYAAGQRFTNGVIWGAIAASVLGWAVVWWRGDVNCGRASG